MIEDERFKKGIERVVLIGAVKNKEDAQRIDEYLDELAFLTKTAGGSPLERFVQRIGKPDPGTFLGKGKIKEIASFIAQSKVDTAIFDDELTPTQTRNVEKLLNCKVLDRSDLILDIFAKRARTSHAKTQVELAQYQNLLPRLSGMWTHHSRQKGGIGTKGPGEREIETDRRMIQKKIDRLKKQLEKIDKQKATQRKNRGKLVRVALIGYTNVGKSSLMNLLSKSEVFEEDKLFATLDTTVRKVALYNVPVLLSDTVGFIRKLPHQLIESFKSTLDEVRESDLLLHVVDVSHPNFEDQYEVVNQTLQEIGVIDQPMITVFNKIDRYREMERATGTYDETVDEKPSLEELRSTWMARMDENEMIFVSAAEKENIKELRDLLYERAKAIHVQRYPYDDLYY